MKGFSRTPLAYARYRLKMFGGASAHFGSNNNVIYQNETTGKLTCTTSPGYTPIDYDEWKARNSDSGYNRFTRHATVFGCSLGIAFAIHQNAKSRTNSNDDGDYYGCYEPCRDCTAVFGALFGGTVGAGVGYLAYLALPAIFAFGGVIAASRILGRVYTRKDGKGSDL
jgi:hypothetical protein